MNKSTEGPLFFEDGCFFFWLSFFCGCLGLLFFWFVVAGCLWVNRPAVSKFLLQSFVETETNPKACTTLVDFLVVLLFFLVVQELRTQSLGNM